MNVRKASVRVLSFLLAFCMVFGLLPIDALSVRATEDPVVVIAGSDFQHDSGNSASAATVTGILNSIQEDYSSIDGFLFAGDYSNNYDYTSSVNGKNALTAAVEGVYGTDWDGVYVQGNHDVDSLVTDGVFSPSGKNDPDSGDYGVFVIHEQDYMWHNDDEARIRQTAENLDAYLDAKVDDGYTKPIFVISHLPLHYTMRNPVEASNGKGDGTFANYIFDVLNEGGTNGLNIIFLYGHNHAHGWDNYIGGEAVYLKKGDKINIAQKSTTVYKEETLNFTYMNAGFTGYYTDKCDHSIDNEDYLTMTVFEITGSQVIVKRYNQSEIEGESSEYNLKSAGRRNTHVSTKTHGYATETMTVNTDIYASGQIIQLTETVPETTEPETSEPETSEPETSEPETSEPETSEPETSEPETSETDPTEAPTVPETPTDVTVGDVTASVSSATVIESGEISNEDKALLDSKGYKAYVAIDIQAKLTGDAATISVPVPSGWDSSRMVGISVENGEVKEIPGTVANGVFSFPVTHFSAKGIALAAEAGEDVNINNWVEIPGGKIYTLDTNGVTANKNYLIASGSSGNVSLLTNNSSNTPGSTAATVSDSKITVTDDSKVAWVFNNATSGNVKNGSYYVDLNSNNVLTTTERTLSISSQNNGAYRISYSTGNSWNRTTYYLRYNNSWQRSISTSNVYLYEYTSDAPGGYAGMTGQTDYSLVTGRYADQAAVVAMIKENIKVYTASDSNGTGATETTNYQITGTVDPSTKGDYTLTVTYGGKELGKITVTVSDKAATEIVVNPMEGSVERGSGKSATTGSTMTVTYDDDTSETIPVTVGMLSDYNVKKNGTYTGLSITYAGKTVTGYTLKVVDVVGNDFPSYPDQGSVKVEKSAAGQDFQNTGVARVELSTSGLPVQHGVDVIIMLDTSSSMQYGLTTSSGASSPNRRIDALETALKNLLELLQTKDADGNYQDIDIAIADFNGNEGHIINEDDYFSGVNAKINDNNGNVYTNNNGTECDAEDFKDIGSINITNITNQLATSSGTNYDWAFETIYKLGAAKQAANGDEERELIVIFMSDGAPFQWNHFSGNGNQPGTTKDPVTGEDVYSDHTWEHWITGEMTTADWNKYQGGNPGNRHFYNEDGLNWMAEAVKGTGDKYPVIYNGTNLGTDASGDYGKYFRYVPGLGATVYTIGLSLYADGNVGTDAIHTVMSAVASTDVDGNPLYTTAYSKEDLDKQFADIGHKIIYAAQNAVFEDQMGTAFDLQMNPTIKTNNPQYDGTTTDISTDITVTEYPVYTKADLEEGKCIAEDVGKAYGDGTVKETVSFTVDEDGNIIATSTAVAEADGNILNDGVICAQNFFYNTTTSAKTITLTNGSTYSLPGETFYWNIGTINEKKFTLSYAVYLSGSMQGETLPSDSYETNNYAKLSYTNWLGNDVSQSVPSPAMPWRGANVSYAFYMVNDEGDPVDASGNVVENVNVAYKVTQPVLYKQILLNSGETVLSTVADDVLPVGYTLYDESAVYTVKVNSGDGGGSWTITGDYPASTYVTGYAGPEDFSNATPVNDGSYEYTHTTVYFAVVWTIGTVPDTVVIDYGLPVDISVLANDMFGNNGTLAGVGLAKNKPTSHSNALDPNFTNSVNGTYGTAKVNGSKVTYTLNTTNGMQMQTPEELAYAVNYTGTTNPGYYYGTVTVIPATTIYYEDSFLTLNGDGTSWTPEGTTTAGATQAEDRPGKYSLSTIDANNVYGYDGAYAEMSTYSLGSAAKVHVGEGTSATATFSFYGTGFDVIGLTSNDTGTIFVNVTGGDINKNYIVDTYYGMTWDETNGWKIVGTTEDADSNASADNNLYQVPVMKVSGLTYGMYTATITATYNSFFDHTKEDGYDLYLDAIRIYDPTGNLNDTANGAYVADGEGWPIYHELRNLVIKKSGYEVTSDGTVVGNDLAGVVFIDGDAATKSIADYVSYGPNNELYLAQGQAVAFEISDAYMNAATLADVQLAVKSVSDATTVSIFNGTVTTDTDGKTVTTTADQANNISFPVNTATDMYHSILTQAKGGTIVVTNETNTVLSITNLKFTFTAETEFGEASPVKVNGKIATDAIRSLTFYEVTTNVADTILEKNEVEPEATETEPKVEETKPEVKETEPEVKETEPKVEETKPEVKETEPKVEETKPEVKIETKVEETKPEVKIEPKAEETKPEVKIETKVEEIKPEVKTEPKAEETKPEVKIETKVEEIKPEVKIETKAEETKPEVKIETKAEEIKPEVEKVPTNNTSGINGVMNNIRNAITNVFKTLFDWLIG